MLDMVFGFNVRLGRLTYFLSSIALGISNMLLLILAVYYTYRVGPTQGLRPFLLFAGWPLLVVIGFTMVSNFMLAAMRIRDIGWDPVVVISAWVAVLVIDWMIASRMPALALAQQHGTIIGGLINFGLMLALLFWPGAERAAAPPRFDDFVPSEPRGTMRGSASVASDRIARFGHRD
jgi:uncharacterized membrane protein YhaH (DUF805 family)